MKKSVDGNTMEMIHVESKNLSYIGYDEEKNTLMIEFTRGPVYIYNEVPKNVYEVMLSTATLDDYFNENIKNSYKNKRVN